MAAIDRRTTAELLTEHTLRVGRTGDTNYTARAKEFLSSAHRYVASRWFHRELFKLDSGNFSCSAGSSTVNIASLGCLIITNVDLKRPSGTRLASLTYQHPRGLWPRLDVGSNGQPSKYTRAQDSSGNDSLHFDRLADKAYDLDIAYYDRPANLDDTTGNLAVAEEWDEPVLILSESMAHRALWQPELAEMKKGWFREMVSELTNPLLLEAGLPGEPIRSTNQRVQAPGGAAG